MDVELHLVLSATLFAIGVGSALSKRNLISIIMAICTAGLGAIIALAALDRQTTRDNDGILFAFCLGGVLLAWIILGGVLAYRRFVVSGSTNIDDDNELRH